MEAPYQLSPLKIIPGDRGSVRHALKATDATFQGFGEAYFSTVEAGMVKGWKRHTQMVLNLVVVSGIIRFVIADDSQGAIQFHSVILGPDVNYQRLTVPAGFWMAFQGVGEGLNMLLNIASIPHDPLEAENSPVSEGRFDFDFSTGL